MNLTMDKIETGVTLFAGACYGYFWGKKAGKSQERDFQRNMDLEERLADLENEVEEDE